MREANPGFSFRVRFEAPVAAPGPANTTNPQPGLPFREGHRLVLFLRAPAGMRYLRDAPPPSGAHRSA